ncbi:MAG TPA: hypothetical protein VI894_01120 [Candidatus Nanoarchaeia archaeon]|nr:hypothetical protein [Candidatus Nanoarchaeia archaeon]
MPVELVIDLSDIWTYIAVLLLILILVLIYYLLNYTRVSKRIVILYEVLFVFGFAVVALAFLSQRWFVLTLGIFIAVLSLVDYELKIKYPEKDMDKIKDIQKKSDELIAKEAELNKRKNELNFIVANLESIERTQKQKQSELEKKQNEIIEKEMQVDQIIKQIEESRSMDQVQEAVKKYEHFEEQEIIHLLLSMDKLLESLPENEVNEFTKTESFKLYEKIIAKIKINEMKEQTK